MEQMGRIFIKSFSANVFYFCNRILVTMPLPLTYSNIKTITILPSQHLWSLISLLSLLFISYIINSKYLRAHCLYYKT